MPSSFRRRGRWPWVRGGADDVINGPKDFDETRALHQMRERFGFGCCFVLKINSLVPRAVAILDGYASIGEDEEWENEGSQSPFVEDGLATGYSARGGDPVVIRGACLSLADKRAIRRYVANMVAMGSVLAIEGRIGHSNAAVSNAIRRVSRM
mmetsp:Transcript_22789/g.40061  ORF Transcript_22789/g.40061 Transcript_22789/m.40061 type:complete len:153 (-) Transcript_22789:913-1371(-)